MTTENLHLYEIAVVQDKGDESKIVVSPTAVLARSDESARIQAIRLADKAEADVPAEELCVHLRRFSCTS